jgi:fatty acid desaturase
MTDETEDLELKDRLSLIETMIAEGRRTTESWGWTFVLWGVAYYIAIGWSILGRPEIAWPVTMIASCVVMVILISRKRRSQPRTALGRSMSAIWASLGISMFILLMCLGLSGRYDLHSFIAIIAAMLGMANASSSMILRWRMQFACAVVWWVAAAVSCFGSEEQTSIAFLVAIFFCQIVFGIYGMIAESRKRQVNAASQGSSHA